VGKVSNHQMKGLMIKKIIYILLSALALIGSLAGCQLFSGETSTPGEGDILNLYSIDPYTLDPAVSSEMTSHQYITQLFGGLVYLDDKLEPAPDIAERWEVSDNGRTYTFYLRQDVRFHDGRQLTAEDFKYSWERACAPATGSQTAANFLGDIAGASDVLAGRSRKISGVKVLGDHVLQVTIDTPKSYFLFKLTYPTTFVVDRANVESGMEWWRHSNGTGPFKLQQWVENTRLVLEKNEDYYGEQARVDSVVFKLWGGVPMNMYESGEIDITDVASYYIDRVQDEAGLFYQELSIVPELSFYYIGFNTTSPPFDDVNIRQAFSQAIDKDKLATLLLRGMAERAEGILPPGMPGYNSELSGLDFNIARAKELIAASEYGDVYRLPPVTITTLGWGGVIPAELEAIVHEWRQNLGVEVKVRQLEPERFFYNLKQERDEMFYLSWIADYPHPQNFLDVLFRTGADNNYGEYTNPEVDSLLEMAAIEPDYDTGLALYQEAEQRLVDDAAFLPLWFGKTYVLIKPYVKGYNLNPLGFVRFNEVYIEPH
jgi:oligopeptide transport system substrate-binding protein